MEIMFSIVFCSTAKLTVLFASKREREQKKRKMVMMVMEKVPKRVKEGMKCEFKLS